jgi:chorismate-pyruvate lyase
MNTLVNGIDILAPLYYFYQSAYHVFPELKMLDGHEVPEPAKQLLVHENDMTPTLIDFFQDEIYLTVLHQEEEHLVIKREVILHLMGCKSPVEFGAIKIDISCMPDHVRNTIREGKKPLGGILAEYNIIHTSHPSGFFEVSSDDVMRRAFSFQDKPVLYGRCNTLRYENGGTLAEVVEVLPPLEGLLAIRKDTQ